MKKIMLIVIGLFVLCGCSANATINIDENENVSENVYLYVTNDVIELNDMTKEEFLDEEYSYNKNDKISSYESEKVFEDNISGMKFLKNTNGMCKAFNESAFKAFFQKFTCVDEDDYYEINANSNFICDESDCSMLKNVNLKITLPSKALDSNANSVSNNTYEWNFDGDNDKLYLKIKKNKSAKTTNIINGTTKTTKENTIDKKQNNKMIILLIIGSILIVILIVLNLYGKYKRKRLDY